MSAATTMPIIHLPVSPQVRAARLIFGLLSKASPHVASHIAVRLFLTPIRRPYSQMGQRALANAEPIKLLHGSRELQGYIWGDAGRPTVLLVHGWEANAGAMRTFVSPLLERGYRVMAFDAPAHGRSTGRSTTIYDYSGALQRIGEEFGPIDGIIAHSLGAAASILMLGREAKLGVKKIVLLGAPSSLVDFIQAWGTFLHIPTKVIAQMRERLIDRIGLPLDEATLHRAVANISVPSLIIHDENDTIVPYSNALAIQKQWRSASLTSTQGLDHRGILYDPETVDLSVAFVTSP